MVSVGFLVGIGGSVLAGAAIGGAAMGIAFGPSVESDSVSRPWAAALLTVFALAGALTIGRQVVGTLARDLLTVQFPVTASVLVVLAVALAVALSDASGLPASTSMSAVGAIAAVGLAGGTLDWATMGQVAVWWLLSPVLALWACLVLGRYVYPHLRGRVELARSPGPLVTVDATGDLPTLAIDDRASTAEALGTAGFVAVGCFAAFALGASNVANAVAPVVGSALLTTTGGILLGSVAVGLGAVVAGPFVGRAVNDVLAGVPLSALLVVGAVAAALVSLLAAAGVPASFVLTAVGGLVGLALGGATRDGARGETVPDGTSWHPLASLAAGVPEADSLGSESPLGGSSHTGGDGDGAGTRAAAFATDASGLMHAIVVQTLVPAIAAFAAYLFVHLLGVA